MPPHFPLSIVESHVFRIEQIVSNHKLDLVILCGDYNIPHVSWSSDSLGLCAVGSFSSITFTILDSFSFLNFFQLNSYPNKHGIILDLIFSNTNNISVCLSVDSLVIPDPYHPPLNISVPL